jgi:hypothetical protein
MPIFWIWMDSATKSVKKHFKFEEDFEVVIQAKGLAAESAFKLKNGG